MIALQDVEPGTRLRLVDGTIVTVVDNPRDGLWVIAAREPGGAGDMVHCDDVRDVVPAEVPS